jgi:glycosyltransferase involved in cell wall biosynthesis
VSAALPLVLVVPVYHEQETIGRTLDELASKVPIPHRTLVVYDKDDDPTVPVVKALLPRLPHVELVKNDIKRGVLGAIRKGFQVAMEVPGDAAVCVVMADLSRRCTARSRRGPTSWPARATAPAARSTAGRC